MGIFDAPTAGYLAEEILIRADAMLALALERAEDDTHRERIRRERLGIAYTLLVQSPLDSPHRTQREDTFIQETLALGITELFERRELMASLDCIRGKPLRG